MRLALIPPFSGMHFITPAFTYQLMLPQLLDNKEYAKKYRYLCGSNFTIMDNGAAEGKMLRNRDLMALAQEYQPSELILPDVIGDAHETVGRIIEFLSRRPRHHLYADMGLMAVAQGQTAREVQQMLDTISTFDRVTAIGIPRHLVETIGNKTVRLTLARWIHERYGKRFEIHFLGSAPSWPMEVYYAQELGFVRGMDTSMPFNYALNDVAVREGVLISQRGEGYFEAEFTTHQDELARRNCIVMNTWALH